MASAKFKSEDDETTSGQGGRPVQSHEPTMDIDEARFIQRLYQNGGAGRHVTMRNATLRDVTRYREKGLIDVLEVRGAVKGQLTARGLQALPQALKVIAEAPRGL